jgi:hypothetical protein
VHVLGKNEDGWVHFLTVPFRDIKDKDPSRPGS